MTGLQLNGKVVDLVQLQTELVAAGFTVNGLGQIGDTLVTYDNHGNPIDLPAGAATVLAAHVPSTVFQDQMTTLLSPLVGVAVANLTQAQRLQMLLGIAAAVGAIDRRTLVVRPLNTWLLT